MSVEESGNSSLCQELPGLLLKPVNHYDLDAYIRLESTLWEPSLEGNSTLSVDSTTVLLPNGDVRVLECQYQLLA
jgi:hypothetical protein